MKEIEANTHLNEIVRERDCDKIFEIIIRELNIIVEELALS